VGRVARARCVASRGVRRGAALDEGTPGGSSPSRRVCGVPGNFTCLEPCEHVWARVGDVWPVGHGAEGWGQPWARRGMGGTSCMPATHLRTPTRTHPPPSEHHSTVPSSASDPAPNRLLSTYTGVPTPPHPTRPTARSPSDPYSSPLPVTLPHLTRRRPGRQQHGRGGGDGRVR
jgi:hypothetical protein